MTAFKPVRTLMHFVKKDRPTETQQKGKNANLVISHTLVNH